MIIADLKRRDSREKVNIMEQIIIEELGFDEIKDLCDFLETHLEDKCIEKDLCTKCYSEMEPGCYVSEIHEYWGHKKTERVATKLVCPDCNEKRDL